MATSSAATMTRIAYDDAELVAQQLLEVDRYGAFVARSAAAALSQLDEWAPELSDEGSSWVKSYAGGVTYRTTAR
jgi:hypothetical protein